LDIEVTPYTQLYSMVATSEQFDHLWHIAYDFQNYYETWFNGKIHYVYNTCNIMNLCILNKIEFI